MSDRLHPRYISGTVQLRKSSPVTEVSVDESFNFSSFDRGNFMKVKSMMTILRNKTGGLFSSYMYEPRKIPEYVIHKEQLLFWSKYCRTFLTNYPCEKLKIVFDLLTIHFLLMYCSKCMKS